MESRRVDGSLIVSRGRLLLDEWLIRSSVFHDLPEALSARMRYLEAADAADRENGTPRLERLRQISRETGQFLAILVAAAPSGSVIEIGTSAGYSTLWLAVGCTARNAPITTFEVLAAKAVLATQTFQASGIAGSVRLVQADAREHLGDYADIAFCFLDAEKDVYAACYELVVPRLVRGGILVADNVLSHKDELEGFVRAALMDERMDAVVVPLGKGLLISRHG